MAEPASTSVVVPAPQTKSKAHREEWSPSSGRPPPWREIIVVDDGSGDGTGDRADPPGAQRRQASLSTRETEASVKSGIRAGLGRLRAHHRWRRPTHGRGCSSDRLTPRRAIDLDGGRSLVHGAGDGDPAARELELNWVAGYLTGRPIPDLTSGLRAGRRVLPRVYPSAPQRLFDADDHDTGLPQGRLQRRIRANERATPCRSSKIRFASDGASSSDPAGIITIFSPLRIFVPFSLAAFAVGVGYGIWTAVTQPHLTNSSVLLILLRRRRLPGRAGLGTDLDAPIGRPALRQPLAKLLVVLPLARA